MFDDAFFADANAAQYLYNKATQQPSIPRNKEEMKAYNISRRYLYDFDIPSDNMTEIIIPDNMLKILITA